MTDDTPAPDAPDDGTDESGGPAADERTTDPVATEAETADEADARYGAITTAAGELILYDRDNPEAWLQSDFAVEVGDADGRQRA